MALEDHNGNHLHQERSKAELPFEDLAKGLASGTVSRRKTLQLMGAALVGGALASIPGVAWAAKGGNRESSEVAVGAPAVLELAGANRTTT
jgi:hypothetical protein